MNYDEIYTIIASYAPDMLPLYADKWSRLPNGDDATRIVSTLQKKSAFYRAIDTDIAERLTFAARTLAAHLR